MNNYHYNKLLWRPTHFRTFHLLRGHHYSVNNRSSSNDHTTNLPCSTSSNVNYDGISNSGIMSSTGLVRAISSNHQRLLSCTTITAHFCTNTTTTSNIVPSSDQQNNTTKLPDQIEQQCREWAQILRAECTTNRNDKQQNCWMKKELKCRKVLPGLLKKTTRLYLSTKNLTPEQLLTLRNSFPIGQHVELKEHLSHQPQQRQSANSIDPPPNNTKNLRGIVDKYSPNGISISVNRHFKKLQLRFKQCTFLIKKTANPGLLGNGLAFLTKRHSNWCKWPGFKCQPRPEDIGVDPPVDWAGINGKNLDPSQCAALSAALNMKRPIVAVHGPPGSGKTRILMEYLHILSQQGKKVLVVSSADAGLYHLMGTFCKKFPSAASSNGTFLYMKHFDAQLASKMIGDERIVRLIEANSSADKLTEQLHEIERVGKGKSSDLSTTTTQGTSICFTNTSYSRMKLFARLGLNNFDVVIIDDAVKLSQFKSSWKALPTAPVLRLFGDYNQPGIRVRSSIGRKLNSRKSLLQRLDEQFGEEVNFHLRRQYRSNAAIQAWPNRAFYGQRAAEPDESVRNIRLDDLLEEGKSPPPELIMDPLVLVDLGQIEEHDPMFKAEAGGRSWFNLGEAFLTASHLWHLFEHIPQLHPSKIAHLTHHGAQRHMLWSVFSALFKHHLEKLAQIRMERSAYLQGQQFDVVIQDCVTVPPSSDVFIVPYHLKRLNFEMCMARRQFIWFVNSKWLEEGSEQSRQLLQTFRQYGRIVEPDQLLPPAESSEFWKMPPMEMEEENCHQQEKKPMNKRKRRGIREFLSFFRS